MADILTRNVRVYSTKVIAALILTAQLPNSSSLKPLPPLPSVTQRITKRYMAETTVIVIITSQIDAPKVVRATPARTISFKNGPNTYNGEVAGSPPPARAPSNALFNLLEIFTDIQFFLTTPPVTLFPGVQSNQASKVTKKNIRIVFQLKKITSAINQFNKK